MEKAFYFTVEHKQVDEYKKILDLMKIPYFIESPVALLKDGADQYAFVFPHMSGRLYEMVRKLFRGDGKAYPH
ncbi:hypothetical protein NDK47_13230 [Brevibacillus ruminantium]|uniref:Uncharacterized protein n=1 Tax=Brevibacillus ruminantium TaxID=2950604 RepID=A0ABY4WLZ6_9BACL|nr:hypothetical protein [Brevibacillus ruminantium]USG68180.1 hypothetical protein NDK47_13230 [Brevibacillus ruminantium]